MSKGIAQLSQEMSAQLSDSDIPKGFRFAATHCGLKKAKLDLAILVSEFPASAAAVFTTNQVVAAPVVLSRAHLKRSRHQMRGLIVNSGNANCCTGSRGDTAAASTASKFAAALGDVSPSQLIVCSTGVIGAPLRVEKILAAIPGLIQSLRSDAASFAQLARAIMTTDTRPKWAGARYSAGGRQIRIIGCAKGSGMIMPNLATMLSFIATDASISPAMLDRALRAVVGPTFNSITVDGDSSTNDTAAVIANGQSGARKIASDNADFRKFCAALDSVCKSLALAIVADGEGAQRVIEVEVRGAPSARAADQVARTIANSPLVKTAFAGADPNWGRILAAAGRSGVRFNFKRVDISIAGLLVCRRGGETPFSERVAHQKMLASFVPVVVDLRAGSSTARIWTCDFTGEYVYINSSYRT